MTEINFNPTTQQNLAPFQNAQLHNSVPPRAADSIDCSSSCVDVCRVLWNYLTYSFNYLLSFFQSTDTVTQNSSTNSVQTHSRAQNSSPVGPLIENCQTAFATADFSIKIPVSDGVTIEKVKENILQFCNEKSIQFPVNELERFSEQIKQTIQENEDTQYCIDFYVEANLKTKKGDLFVTFNPKIPPEEGGLSCTTVDSSESLSLDRYVTRSTSNNVYFGVVFKNSYNYSEDALDHITSDESIHSSKTFIIDALRKQATYPNIERYKGLKDSFLDALILMGDQNPNETATSIFEKIQNTNPVTIKIYQEMKKPQPDSSTLVKKVDISLTYDEEHAMPTESFSIENWSEERSEEEFEIVLSKEYS